MSLEFLRQGKTAEETGILIKNATMMSKLGNIDAAESSELLTSTMNGFKLSAEETSDVVDRLVALDNSASTSIKEVATAMRYTSNTAREVGVDFEHLAAYIGTVSAVSRMSAETVGQAFKTIFSRMSDVKSGKAIDQEGEAINNVEESLLRVNIHLRDANGHFRSMQEVMGEIQSRWSSIGDEDRKFIARQIAGLRQKETFLTLMDNQLEFQKQLTAETESAGLAEERYAIYQEGIEAAQNRMLAAWQKLATSGATKDLIVDFYSMGTAILELVNNLGGIPTILKIAIPLLILFNMELITTKALAIRSAWTSFRSTFKAIFMLISEGTSITEALNVAFGTTAVTAGVLTAGIIALIAVVQTYNEQIVKRQTEGMSENVKHWKDVMSSATSATEAVKKYKEELARLNAVYEESGIIDDLFVDKQNILKNGFIEAAGEISNSASSWEEYQKTMMDAVTAAGYMVDAQGKVFRPFRQAGGITKQYIGDITILTEEQWRAKFATDALAESTANQGDSAEQASQQTASWAGALSDAQRSLVDKVVQMIKDMKNAEKDALQEQLRDYKDYIEQEKQAAKDLYDTQKRMLDERKKQLDREYETEKRNRDARKQAIRDQLDAYKRIISAQKELLKQLHEQEVYERERENKQDKLARLQEQIMQLSLDDSAEATAQRLQLEQEAADLQEEMANDAADHQYELDNQALDNEQNNAEQSAQILLDQLEAEQNAADRIHELKQQEIEDALDAAQQAYEATVRSLEDQYNAREKYLQDQIAQIDSYLKQEGQINQDALDLIKNHSEELYTQLLEWNRTYGTGIDQDIIDIWDAAIAKVEEYSQAVQNIPASPTDSSDIGVGTNNMDDDWKEHHTGVRAGPVGGKFLDGTEEFIKVLKGEVVVTPGDMRSFVSDKLPSMISSSAYSTTNNMGGINISMPLSVGGNLDRSVLPEIESIVEKAVKQLNKNLLSRGFNRRAEAFGL